jgi:hypothetical protein
MTDTARNPEYAEIHEVWEEIKKIFQEAEQD